MHVNFLPVMHKWQMPVAGPNNIPSAAVHCLCATIGALIHVHGYLTMRSCFPCTAGV